MNFRDMGSLQGSSGEASASHPGIGRAPEQKGSRTREPGLAASALSL